MYIGLERDEITMRDIEQIIDNDNTEECGQLNTADCTLLGLSEDIVEEFAKYSARNNIDLMNEVSTNL